MIVFIVILIVSTVSDSWTLNAGETRQVKTKAALNDIVYISTNIPDSLTIYALEGSCPPLNGPAVSFGDTEDIQLARGDYQYDYFYLNAGSFLDVTLTQEHGATNVLVFQGLLAAKNYMQNSDDDSFSSPVCLQSYAGAGQTARVQYTPSRSDTYVVVYDNASHSKGHATVSYTVNLTTYNLDGKTPVENCESTNTCSFDIVGHGCILVRAESEVTVHISASRRWGALFFYSAIPLVIGYFCLKVRKEEDVPQAEDAGYPPATAPQSQAYHAGYPPATALQAQAYAMAEPLVDVPEAYAYPVATPIGEPAAVPSAPVDSKV